MHRLSRCLENHLPVESRQPSRRAGLAVVLISLLAMAGCAKHYVNEPLDGLDPQTGYRYVNQDPPDKSEEILFILAFSGGGTRASTLDYGVLQTGSHRVRHQRNQKAPAG